MAERALEPTFAPVTPVLRRNILEVKSFLKEFGRLGEDGQFLNASHPPVVPVNDFTQNRKQLGVATAQSARFAWRREILNKGTVAFAASVVC